MAQQWTPERVQRLRDLVAAPERWSAQQIADRMGVTRNAVLGKVERLKLKLVYDSAKRSRAKQGGWGAKAVRKVKVPSAVELALAAEKARAIAEAARPPTCKPVEFFNLDATHCRWPVEPWEEGARMYCGDKALFRKPYCAYHEGSAWRGGRGD